jgi:hypothetical protein
VVGPELAVLAVQQEWSQVTVFEHVVAGAMLLLLLVAAAFAFIAAIKVLRNK